MKRFLVVLIVLILVSGGLAGCASAEFEVSPLTITPSQVVPGETFTVSAEIANVGDADGVYTATLTVNGIERTTKDITVAAGRTEIVSFTMTEETPGSYNIALNGMTASLKLPSTDEIIIGVAQSLYDVNTYQFDLDITMDIAGEVDGEAFEMTLATDSSGRLDITNRQMWMETIMRMTIPEEDESVTAMETYIIGNTQYILYEIPETEPMWEKTRLSVGSWNDWTQVEHQIELLEAAEVELIGSDTVRGTDGYILQLTPDLVKLWQTSMQQQQIAGEGIFDIPEDRIQEVFRSVSVKQWIAKETYLLTKAEVEMSMEITPELMGFPEEEGVFTIDMTMSLLAYNYNEPVSIVLPTEAEEALDVTQQQTEAAEETELANIQAAVHALMVDNELVWLPNPVTIATNDMGAFPDTTAVASKGLDILGNAYDGSDKAGFILYQHDRIADSSTSGLVNYVATRYTTYWYYVDAAGTVTQVVTSTQVSTSAPEPVPAVVQEKEKDIESIMVRAEGLNIHVEAVVHEGEIMTITCQADDYTTFRDYLIALEESGRFVTPIVPPEGYPYVKGGTIKLEPKYQYIDMLAVYYEVNQAPIPMTDHEAIAILVSIAENSGIDIDENAGKFRVPSAWFSQEKVGGGTYQVLSFRNIQLQGDYRSVMAFISDLDSCTTLKTMILTRVSISQTEVYGKIETTAALDVDIYSIES